MTRRIDLYRLGVFRLKRLIRAAEDISDLLQLPADALAGAAKVSVTGGKHALIENHRGLLGFSETQVTVALNRGKLIISGSALQLVTMTVSQLSVSGKIQHVEFE